jgi:hypothetical protein
VSFITGIAVLAENAHEKRETPPGRGTVLQSVHIGAGASCQRNSSFTDFR